MMATFSVTFKTPDGEEVIDVPDDQYILDTAEEQGLDLPYSCRSGMFCLNTFSACEGEREADTPRVINCHFCAFQMEKGFSLLCVAYPASDLVIETHKEEDLY
ncbi:hypothetical protein H632_c100p2 [Helicosporidium sp. ATCC 50920]|nr:hypothetical protein H632_c100p2 [Helicosporidium sp. ATCC 50920]|eukprot:KDD76800.1 hypothetical protein H632_c100p2 [Helicosporidium sp. ATCC 50920]